MTESILQEADRIINGQRRQDYGGVTESFTTIAGMWAAYLGHEVTTYDVVNLMALLKVARAKNGYHRDSYVDICGYSALTEKLVEEAALAEAFAQDQTEDAIYDGVYNGGVVNEEPVGLDEPKKSGGTIYVDVKPRLNMSEWRNEFLQSLGLPRQWKSIADVPLHVQVTDRIGDIWSYNAVLDEWGFEVLASGDDGAVPWGPVSSELELSNWDGFAPFVEVLVPKKPEPRVWQELHDVPHDVRVRSAGGEVWKFWEPGEVNEECDFAPTSVGAWLWGGDNPYSPLFKTAPFTEVLEGTV